VYGLQSFTQLKQDLQIIGNIKISRHNGKIVPMTVRTGSSRVPIDDASTPGYDFHR